MFAGFILLAIAIGCVHSQTELTLPPLPYAYNALEPVISERLMRLHYDRHFRTYANQTNVALKAMFFDRILNDTIKAIAKQPIEVILTQVQTLPDQYHIALRHSGGGYLNHKLFFSMLKPPTTTAAENKLTGPLLEAIERSFGSFDKFKELFSGLAVSLFGSGWIWLYIEAGQKRLVLNFTANQDNPIIFNKDHVVVLGIDLWEHAYYLDYEDRRSEYVENFWRLVNWPYVTKLYTDGQARRSDL